MTPSEHADRDPAVAELLEDAFISPVDVETAARHLWAIHRAADLSAAERDLLEHGSDEVPDSLAVRRFPRALAPLVALVMLMSMSGVAVAASRGSLPGDVLYGLKRGQETAQLVFTRDPAERLELQVAFAEVRLEEIRAVGTSRPDVVPELVAEIAETLSEVEQTVSADPDRGPAVIQSAERIRQETSQEVAELGLPSEIDDAVGEVLTAAEDDEAAAAEDDAAATEPADPSATAVPSTTPSLDPTEDKGAEDRPATGQVTEQPAGTPTAADEGLVASAPPVDAPGAGAAGATSPPPDSSPAAPPAATAEPVPGDPPVSVRPPDVVTGPAGSDVPGSAPPTAQPIPTPIPSVSPTPAPSAPTTQTPTAAPLPPPVPSSDAPSGAPAPTAEPFGTGTSSP